MSQAPAAATVLVLVGHIRVAQDTLGCVEVVVATFGHIMVVVDKLRWWWYYSTISFNLAGLVTCDGAC